MKTPAHPYKKILIFLVCVALLIASFGTPYAATPQQSIQAATAAYQNGNFRDAAQLFMVAGDELAKANNPQGALLWGNGALSFFKGGNFQDAARIYDKLLSGKYKLPQDKLEQYYTNLIICRSKLDEPALTVQAINRMLKAVPKIQPLLLANIYAALGDAYRSLELYGPAASAYDKALHVLPPNASQENRAKMMAALGQAQRNMGQYDRAISNYTASENIGSQLNHAQLRAEAQSNLGIINTDIGDYPAAIERLNSALDISRKAKLRLQEGSDLANMGQVYIYTGKYNDAKNKFDESISIAKEVGNVKGEAVATVNRALVNRLAGELNAARNDYKRAMQLFDQCGLREGLATAHLGQGRMEEFAENDYVQALKHYEKALDIFTDLKHPRGQASALLMLADLYKATHAPKRTTRDLSFNDEPANIEISPADALAKSRDAYARALKIAEEIGAKEIIWGAHQGLGYSEYKNGNPESALSHYQKAIDLVTGMYLSREDAQLFGEYMAGKEALYNEAQEICAALYDKTKDKKYLDLQLKYADTLNNEVQKASAALASLKYENPVKQGRFEKLQALAKKRAQLEKTRPVVKSVAQNATPEEKETSKLISVEVDQRSKEIARLDKEYDTLLAEWKKAYPTDRAIFESRSGVDIASIQKALKSDQAVLQYVSLPDKLIINCIRKDSVESQPVPIDKEKLNEMIRQKFILDYLHYGFAEGRVQSSYDRYLHQVSATLHDLHNILIKPMSQHLEGIKRLYVLNDGMLSNLPYSALVTDNSDPARPQFLIEKYEIGNIRPAFAQVLKRKPAKGAVKKMLAVANPVNNNFDMGKLSGTIKEIKIANNTFHEKQADKNIALVPMDDPARKLNAIQAAREDFPELPSPPEEPTETWLKNKLSSNNYEMLYFATHGQTQSDTFSKIITGINKYKKTGKKFSERQQRMKAMLDGNLSEKSPLNGFLYLNNEPQDDILKAPIPSERDGLLTLKEILELDPEKFSNTRFVILSACNTAISMVPAAVAEGYDSGEKNEDLFDPNLVEKEMTQHGMVPGIDQVTFVESFMKKGVQDVYASYWPVYDAAATIYMPTFIQTLVGQGDNPDPIAALAEAQKQYINLARDINKLKEIAREREDKDLEKMAPHAIHPYYWAVGAIFGK